MFAATGSPDQPICVPAARRSGLHSLAPPGTLPRDEASARVPGRPPRHRPRAAHAPLRRLARAGAERGRAAHAGGARHPARGRRVSRARPLLRAAVPAEASVAVAARASRASGARSGHREPARATPSVPLAGRAARVSASAATAPGYWYDNESFGSGDAEILYSIIRHFRPRRIVEIGSGRSTLMAAAALRRNREDDPSWTAEHVCIEPYEMPWLESSA